MIPKEFLNLSPSLRTTTPPSPIQLLLYNQRDFFSKAQKCLTFSYCLLGSSVGSSKFLYLTYKTIQYLLFAFLNSTPTLLAPKALHLFVQNSLSHSWYSSFHARMEMKANE